MPGAPSGADTWGYMDGNEDVSPGIDYSSARTCCACGKPGLQYRTIDPKCRVKIWIAPSKEPGDPVPTQGNVEGHASSIWDHEVQHAQHFVQSIRNRDNLFKSLGTICVPYKCGSAQVRSLVRFDHAYRSLRNYNDAHINCRDARANCPEASDYLKETRERFESAFSMLNEFLACMSSECGTFNLVGAICGLDTCR